jgi:hypothetical protein
MSGSGGPKTPARLSSHERKDRSENPGTSVGPWLDRCLDGAFGRRTLSGSDGREAAT